MVRARARMTRMIDHLVFAGPDLAQASAAIATILAATPTPGGSHVGRGTCNELLSLGGATYLEVIGPDPAQPSPENPRPFGIDDLTGPALVAWCVRPRRRIDEIVAEAGAAGIAFGAVTAMSRRRPEGEVLEWQLTIPQPDGPFGCALPFMIDWGQSVHPTDTLADGVRLVGVDVFHPKPQLLRTALDIIGLSAVVEVGGGEQPALRARIVTAGGEVTLTS